MVLGGQPPGRVGRRQFLITGPPSGRPFFVPGRRITPGGGKDRLANHDGGEQVIGAIILGIVAGYLGRLIMPGKQDYGFIRTVFFGIVGSLLGYFLFTEVLGIGDTEAFDLGGLPGAVIGVIIVLILYQRLTRRGAEPAV